MKKITLLLLPLFCVGTLFAQSNTNLVVNGDFADGTNGWTFVYQNSADEKAYGVTGGANGLEIAQPTAATGRLDIRQDFKITPGKSYKISFDYKSTHAKFRIWSHAVSDNDVWVYSYGTGSLVDAAKDPLRTNNGYFPVASEWQTMSYDYQAPAADTISSFRLMFRVYKQAASTHNLRNVSMMEVGAAGVAAVKETHRMYTADGMLFIDGKGGQPVEVYSLLGNKIASLTSTDGTTRIQGLPRSEILMVRIKDKTYKVIIR